jgi:hypothetical protein
MLVAVGALVGLAAPVGAVVVAVEGSLVDEHVALRHLVGTVRTRPAYVVTALVGAFVFLFYDG